MRTSLAALLLLLSLPVAAQADALRVCSDPNNLPFSNRAGQGFENRIAGLLARDLHETIAYTWARQGENFLNRTLKARKCDVTMAAPAGFDEVDTTRPYYASTYVFVSRRGGPQVASLTDPRLRKLRIGVHLLGGDPAPPEAALGREGIVNNVSGFMIMGDYAKPSPPARLIEAVERRQIDVAAVWGPLGGYFAKRSPVPLTVTPMTHTKGFAPLEFRFAIAMGVRKGDRALRDRLDAALARERGAVRNILAAYGVPLVEMTEGPDE
jgi:quinoprotein dehydrogenase-associated probable ABC transporter substrate-binding protein